MIQVRLLGGAKKSFDTDNVVLNLDKITINELLESLEKEKPKNTPDLDINNILIAVNGVDSSAIGGKDTKLNSGDVVSIIPVIHGGISNSFTVLKTHVAIFPISGKKNLDYTFLDSLRSLYPNLTIQAVSSKFILNLSHIKKIITISLESKKQQTLLSTKLETDILLRFATTTQISKAIKDLGITPKNDFILIAMGRKDTINKLDKDLSDKIDMKILSRSTETHIKKYFKISKKQLDSVYSKTPLEDILQEQSSVLF